MICEDQDLHYDCLCLPAESASALPANQVGEKNEIAANDDALNSMLNDCCFEPPSWDELKKPMVELLLKYYNGEDQGSDFCSAISAVLRVLCRWNNFG